MTGIRSARYRTAKPASVERRRDAGIILVATLLMLLVLAGLATATQARALSQARLMDTVAERHREAVSWQSARALALPLVGESLLAAQDGETVPPLTLDGQANDIPVDGRTWQVRVQPIERQGWVRLSPGEF